MTPIIKQYCLVDRIPEHLQLLLMMAYFKYIAHSLQPLGILGYKICGFDVLGVILSILEMKK